MIIIPEPNKPKIICFSLDTDAGVSQDVQVLNRTSGERIRILCQNRKGVIDAQNFTSGYTDGDVIEVNTVGKSFGSNTITIDDAIDFQDIGEITTDATKGTLQTGGNICGINL